jgi:glyoxylase-like metal-dependent hydrolase (beta-lactamase superfamily II)
MRSRLSLALALVAPLLSAVIAAACASSPPPAPPPASAGSSPAKPGAKGAASSAAEAPKPESAGGGEGEGGEEAEPEAQVFRFKGDSRIGTYISTPWSFSTSSYWIEGPEGLILIDTQFLPSAAEDFVMKAEAMTGKKVALAIVLHANPDKFNGTAALQARGIKVVTSKPVAKLIPGVHEKRLKAFYSRYEPDYPKDVPQPTPWGNMKQRLTAGGITVEAHVMGPGCSEAHVVVEFDGHLFPGDLVASGNHSWLEIGRTDEWLLRLKEMRVFETRFVHPGRGPSGGTDLLDKEEAYLRKVIAIVAEEKPVLPPPEGAIERVKARVLEAYPGLGFPVFLNLGLPAEWRRQAEAAKKGGG